MEIRSYRRVFELERRLYRVDRLRLNPAGVPVRGVVYLLAIIVAELIVAATPPGGRLLGLLPWYARDLVLPALGAALLGAIRLEGRPFHLAARSLLRQRLGARHLTGYGRAVTVGERWAPDALVLLPNGSDGWLRRLRYTGPGAVRVGIAHARKTAPGPRAWPAALRGRVIIEPRAISDRTGRGVVVELAARTRLEIRRSGPCEHG
jgi:hypothetical protein